MEVQVVASKATSLAAAREARELFVRGGFCRGVGVLMMLVVVVALEYRKDSVALFALFAAL